MLAIALSGLILFGWSALFPKPHPIDNKQVTQSESLAPALVPTPASFTRPAGLTPEVDLKNTIKFSQDNRDIIFNQDNASIVEVIFKDVKEHRFPLYNAFALDSDYLFKLQERTNDSIIFVAEAGNKRVLKKYNLPNNNNIIDLEIIVSNLGNQPIDDLAKVQLGRIDFDGKNPQARYQDVFLGGDEQNLHLPPSKEFSSKIKFLGIRDQYFCIIIEPVNIVTTALLNKIGKHESEVSLILPAAKIDAGKQIGHLLRIYLGPQDLKIINGINSSWSGIIYFGKLDLIAQIILQLLMFFFSILHNWGLAIILLSLTVYFLLFPLSMKQMHSMKSMQALQPKIEALRKEFKNNPQQLNKEVMELYREHKVNPLSGCLPLILQMPIFFALYQALIRSVALRGAKFLWIKDLSAPDGAFVFKNALPVLGNQINILPILMAIGMFVQQKISSPQSTGEAADQQKIMLIIMPIMFGVIFYQMPSGLVLYWFVNSVLMLLYQVRLNRKT